MCDAYLISSLSFLLLFYSTDEDLDVLRYIFLVILLELCIRFVVLFRITGIVVSVTCYLVNIFFLYILFKNVNNLL